MRRKLAVAYISVLLLFGGCLYRAAQEGQELFMPPGLQVAYGNWVEHMKGATPLATLTNAEEWGRKNMTYRKDEFWNIPDSPVYTWHRKAGSCNDTSYLFLDCLYLNQQDQAAVLFTVHNATKGHTVCLLKTDAGYYHASNWDNVRGPFASKQEAASSVYQDWISAVSRSRMMHEIERLGR